MFLKLKNGKRFIKYYYGGQIKDEMRGACSTHGRDEECVQNFGRKA
jgi:hypothetical protein